MKDIVRKVMAKRTKKSFNKENAPELIGQLIKVISRDFEEKEGSPVVKELRDISSEIFSLHKK